MQRTGSSLDPCLTNSYSIWITRLSKASPAPILVLHRLTDTLFRPHCSAFLFKITPPSQGFPLPLPFPPFSSSSLERPCPVRPGLPSSPNPHRDLGLVVTVFYCTELQYNFSTFMTSTIGISRASSQKKFNQGRGRSEVHPRSEVHCQVWLLESPRLSQARKKRRPSQLSRLMSRAVPLLIQ